MTGWTFKSDSCGYMLYYNGQPQGGARTMGSATHTSDGRRRHWKHRQSDTKMHHDTAKRICDDRNSRRITP